MIVIAAARFFLGGAEDSWLCDNGQWVKHGNPASEMPNQGCGEESSVTIASEYAGKIVYANNSSADLAIVKQDCAQRGGEFKPCGSPCGPEAEYCIEVCAYTCEFDLAPTAVNDFASCAAAGNPLLESYPRQCRDKDGHVFVEDLKTQGDKSALIQLHNPQPQQSVSSPLEISGLARGSWFFEASFPVVLVNWDGLIIAAGIAQAQVDPAAGDGAGWMTENFVPFTAALKFESPVFPGADEEHFSRRGALILRKDNPSGLPEHDDALEIPVWFE